MLIRNLILCLIGFSGAIAIAGAVFAFITMIGIIPRFASRTNTAKNIMLYEDMVTIGGTLGNIIILYQINIPVGTIGIILFGLFSGIFVGCLAMALAEVLQVIPVFLNRINLKKGLSILVIAVALGKSFGIFLQLYLFWGH